MNTGLYIILALLGLGLFSGLVWRLASQRQSLPCPAWLGWMVEMENPFTRVNRSSFIINKLNLQPGMRVLDTGCGPGRMTIPLAEALGNNGEVLAMDIQSEMLERVRIKANSRGTDHIQYLYASLGEGRLPFAYFDRAVMTAVLGEIPDPLSALQEVYSALKPGGIFLISELIFDPHFQPRMKVSGMAEAAGFREMDFFGGRLAYSVVFQKPG